MNRDAIRKTAICRFDEQENIYIVESPLLEMLSSAGENENEAWTSFEHFLQGFYIEYLEGKTVGQYKRRGRPAKPGVELHVKVKQATRESLSTLSHEIGCSQGEAIDYLVRLFESRNAKAHHAG